MDKDTLGNVFAEYFNYLASNSNEYATFIVGHYPGPVQYTK
jgi:hypothetical protein